MPFIQIPGDLPPGRPHSGRQPYRVPTRRRLHPVQTHQPSAAEPARPARPPLPAHLHRIYPAAPRSHRRAGVTLRPHRPAGISGVAWRVTGRDGCVPSRQLTRIGSWHATTEHPSLPSSPNHAGPTALLGPGSRPALLPPPLSSLAASPEAPLPHGGVRLHRTPQRDEILRRYAEVGDILQQVG